MSTPPRVRTVYRALLRTMEQWPSVKKDKVVQEIKLEFRQNMGEAEAAKRDKMLAEAEAGLRSLRQQCGLSTESNEIGYEYDAALRPPGS